MHPTTKVATTYRKYIVFTLTIILFLHPVFAQQKLPIINATLKKVDIRDGAVYQKGIWNLSPENKPDTYFALEPQQAKKISFYTDTDSISFSVVPDSIYNFIIVLNSKDSCYTQISTVKRTKTDNVILNDLGPALLKQDLIFFRETLEREHAGLYRYKTKIEIDALLDSCYTTLNHPMPQLEFAKLITFVISFLEDGHTGSNLPRLLMNHYSQDKKMFPLPLYFINDRAYVLCSRVNELPPLTEILSIDNKAIPEIKKKLFQYLPSDGKIETKKNHVLSNGAFPFLYNWIFGNANSFTVKYRTTWGEIKTTRVYATLLKDLECDNGHELNNTKDLQLDFPEKEVALLTIKTFDDNRLTGILDFSNFLESSFKEINARKVSKLIIDVRGNGGGNDGYGALLYAYLTNKPFKYFNSIQSVTKQITVQENALLGTLQPKNNSFGGKVFFLINGLCFSTAADFCAIARSNNRGIFIGEETGGAYYGNTSGQTMKIELRNSKISITIPRFKYVNAVKASKYDERGVIPHHTILPTIDEVILHKDVQLNFALKSANEN